MAKRVYYKVTGMDLQSVCRNTYFPEEYRVEYKVGEFVEPTIEDTRLFVFGDIDSARNFAQNEMNGWGIRIYECVVKNPHPVKYIATPDHNSIGQFWKVLKKARSLRKSFKQLFKKDRSFGLRDEVPTSSYAATHVKLTKELEVYS